MKFNELYESINNNVNEKSELYLDFKNYYKIDLNKPNNDYDWSKVSGKHWTNLLIDHPQFDINADWSKLKGYQWVNLLSEQSQYSDYCDWTKLNGRDWTNLVIFSPDFISKCDEYDGWKLFNSWGWADFIVEYPHLIHKCNLSKLDGWSWTIILLKHPKFENECTENNCWKKLNKHNWKDLISKHSYFKKYLNK